MKRFKVTIAFECQANHKEGANAVVRDLVKRAGFVDYEMLSVEPVESLLDKLENARVAFYAEGDASNKARKEALAYLDIAVKATNKGQIGTTQLNDIWQQVKGHL